MSQNAKVLRADQWTAMPNGNGTQTAMPQFAQRSLWSRIKLILPHREDLTVAGREVKGGIVIHPIIATAILGAIIAIGLSIRSEMSWQHDQILTLRVEKVEAEKHSAERAEELQKRLQNIDAVSRPESLSQLRPCSLPPKQQGEYQEYS